MQRHAAQLQRVLRQFFFEVFLNKEKGEPIFMQEKEKKENGGNDKNNNSPADGFPPVLTSSGG
jgi:hypothetical protein